MFSCPRLVPSLFHVSFPGAVTVIGHYLDYVHHIYIQGDCFEHLEVAAVVSARVGDNGGMHGENHWKMPLEGRRFIRLEGEE